MNCDNVDNKESKQLTRCEKEITNSEHMRKREQMHQEEQEQHHQEETPRLCQTTTGENATTTNDLRAKEDFDYEGRVRIEQNKDKLASEYNNYLAHHPEITPFLHDILSHLLMVQPERPLAAITSYVKSRHGL